MRRVECIEADIQVVLEDVEMKRGEIVSECLKVWDSMTGKLPPFGEFCAFYVEDAFKRWIEKARWN